MAGTVSLDGDTSDLTRSDLRQKIAAYAGHRPRPDTPLGKETLNSVYAYLTGEFYYPPAAANRPDHVDFSSRKDVLVAVVYNSGIGEEADEWSRSVNKQEDMPDALRRDELLTLAEKMKDTKDQRDWAYSKK